MTFMRMQNLSVLIALLLFCTSPTETKVVESMADCSQFFLEGNSPNIPGILEEGNILNQNRYKPICQTLNGIETFVTLYDTENKIPVFSASKYTGNDGTRPKTRWKIEPELLQLEDNDNMQSAGLYRFQAGTEDYSNTDFDRGHLLPSSYGLTRNDRKSTFTLTNIVPQVRDFNKGSWNDMEKCVKCVLDKYCINNNNQLEGFVVIGAQPSKELLKDRINIPSFLWSAFCCYSTTEHKWLASAHWGENVKPVISSLKTMTLTDLHRKLGGQFNVFPGTQCPLTTTVTQLYPNLDQNCNCPPITPTTTAPSTTTSSTVTSISSTFITSTSDPLSTTSGTTSKGTTLKPTSPTTKVMTTTTTTTTTTNEDEDQNENEQDERIQNPQNNLNLQLPVAGSGVIFGLAGLGAGLFGSLFGYLGGLGKTPTNHINATFPLKIVEIPPTSTDDFFATTPANPHVNVTSSPSTAVVTVATEESSTKPSSSNPSIFSSTHLFKEDSATGHSEAAAAVKITTQTPEKSPSKYLPFLNELDKQMTTTQHRRKCMSCFRRFKQHQHQFNCLRRRKCIRRSTDVYRTFRRSSLHFPQIVYD